MSTGIMFERVVKDHDPRLYQAQEEAVGLEGLHGVDDQALQQYDEQGYLYVRRAFAGDFVEAALEELQRMAREVDPECSMVSYEGSFRGMLAIPSEGKVAMEDVREVLEAIQPEERAGRIRKFMGLTRAHPALKGMADYGPLRDVLERIVGGRTSLFQSMALIKPPGGREKPWHQDHAYFNYPTGIRIAGVWIALEKVSQENGCMFVLPGRHRQGPHIHFKRRDWQICDTDIYGHRQVAFPMDAGDLMIFDAKLPHGTPTNHSQSQRWALQFHYLPVGVDKFAEEERLAIFGSEGKDVSC